MSDAYVFDAVRTPRGRGRSSGSLHEVSPLRLAAGVLRDIRDRNDLDTSQVDDVILGVADPVNEQGADIARTAVLVAGWFRTRILRCRIISFRREFPPTSLRLSMAIRVPTSTATRSKVRNERL